MPKGPASDDRLFLAGRPMWPVLLVCCTYSESEGVLIENKYQPMAA